jgi:Domain of unknown function (DUF6531)
MTRPAKHHKKLGLNFFSLLRCTAATILLLTSTGIRASESVPRATDAYAVVQMSAIKLRASDSESYQFVRLNPSIKNCRFGALVVAPTGPSALSMVQTITSAAAGLQKIAIGFTRAADGVCYLAAVDLYSPSSASGNAITANGAPTSGTATLQDTLATAADGFSDKYATAYKSAFRDYAMNGIDERVDPITGTLHLKHTDLVIPGPNGFDIKISRHYRSHDPRSVGVGMTDMINPHYNGFGWTMIANLRGMRSKCPLQSEIDAGATWLIDALPVWLNESGNAEPMLFDGNGWFTASGVRIECDGATRIPKNIATLPDGKKVYLAGFDAPVGSSTLAYGLPTRIEDRWGNWIQIDYATEFAYLASENSLPGFATANPVPIKKVVLRRMYCDFSLSPASSPTSHSELIHS